VVSCPPNQPAATPRSSPAPTKHGRERRIIPAA
jgi:hypothetical protein